MTAPIPLDHLAAIVEAYTQAVRTRDQWDKAVEALKLQIQGAMGEATEATVGGLPAFTWRHTGQFAEKRFAQDHPDLVTKYTRPVTRDELDRDTLAAEYPDLYAAYRARRFERKG